MTTEDLSSSTDLPTFDPHSPDLTPEHAYDTYARLRQECPVSRGEAHGGYWSVARYEHVRAVACDHARFSSTGGVYVPPVSEHRFPPIDYDPPEHTVFRKLISPLTSAAAARRMHPDIQAIADRLVDGFADRGSAELVEELAVPLPLDVIIKLYGLEPGHAGAIRDYSLEFLDHASGDAGQRVIARVSDYWMRMFRERRAHPQDDFVSELVGMHDALDVPDEVLANMMFILTYAGHDSTALGLSNMLLYLAEHPDVQQRLADDESLIARAVDEILRYESPLHWFPRVAKEDTRIAGEEVKAGDRVLLLFGSANRDPEAFDRPDEVVIDRTPNRHVAFGAGIHACPGMALARAEIEIAVRTLLRRLPRFRVDGEPARTSPLEGGGRHLGVRRLPVAW